MADKQVRLVDRWAQDAGVAFFDDDDNEERVIDEAKGRKNRKKARRDIDEIEETE